MKHIYTCLGVALCFLNFGCNLGEFNLSGQSAETQALLGAGGSTSRIVFAGISLIDNVSSQSVRLNWTNVSGAAVYSVYDVTNPSSPTYLGNVNAPTSQYIVSGLSTSTAYKFRVRLLDTTGAVDANVNDVAVTTLAVTATHAGWTSLTSIGAKTPNADSAITPALASTTVKATLTWNAFTLSSGTVSSYNIYRATTSGAENYATPYATGISASTPSYTDTTVTAGTIYYYTLAAVVGGVVTPATSSAFSEAKIVVAPPNMVLVHRWIANQEMCGQMGKTSDSANNYRCPYTGPGGNGTYFDIGASFLIDANEVGCNYTIMGTAAPSTSVGSSTAGSEDVFYNRANGVCYIKTAATTWTQAKALTLTTAQKARMATNSSGYPALVVIDQNRSYDTCTSMTAGTFGNKNLPSHKLQIVASAWDPSLNDTTIGTTENGTPGAQTCNSNLASGLTFDSGAVSAGNGETISGTSGSSIKSTRTGGTSTANCVSRYGAQDMIGNVWQWSSDQTAACNSTTHICSGITSTLDTNNTDWNGFNFNGSAGPGGASGVTEWDFSAMTNSSTRFLIPLGLPMVTAAASSYESLAIGTGIGQFDPARFHGDHFSIYIDSGTAGTRGVYSGGNWSGGVNNGRYAILIPTLATATATNLGLRCMVAAE